MRRLSEHEVGRLLVKAAGGAGKALGEGGFGRGGGLGREDDSRRRGPRQLLMTKRLWEGAQDHR